MSRYLNAISEATSTIRVQRWTLGVMTIVTLTALAGWYYKDTHFTAHIPPDLSEGATIKVGGLPEVPAANVYAFGFYLWQQVNNWPTDGGADYDAALQTYQNYITPGCRAQLHADVRRKAGNGELVQRTRSIMEIPGQGFAANRVSQHGNGAWTVLLDTALLETRQGVAVKRTFIRYPLRVVRYPINRDLNPFGLAIDCFGDKRPERLESRDINVVPSMAPNVAIPDVLPAEVDALPITPPARTSSPSATPTKEDAVTNPPESKQESAQ